MVNGFLLMALYQYMSMILKIIDTKINMNIELMKLIIMGLVRSFGKLMKS